MAFKNHLGANVPPSLMRKVKDYAENCHHTKKLPQFLRAWFSFICRACENGFPPETAIALQKRTFRMWKEASEVNDVCAKDVDSNEEDV